MTYKLIEKFGIVITSLLYSLLSIFISVLITSGTHFLVNKTQSIVPLVLSIVIPGIVAPIATYILLKMLLKVRNSEEKLKKINEELKNALDEVNELSEMLPICASCKKIRDDNGYWSQVEEYLSKKTDIKFSHGLCPTCYEKENKKIDEMLKNKNNLNIVTFRK